MSKTRIAIATPNKNAWSETFIAAHLQRLEPLVLVLSDGNLPHEAGATPLLTPVGPIARLQKLMESRLLDRSASDMLRSRITRELKRQRVTVLLAEYGPAAMELLPCAEAAGIPLVAHFHGYDAHRKEPLQRYDNYRALFEKAAAFVVVSRAMERQLLALGAPRDRLHYICYGIDTDRFIPGNAGSAPPHFLSLGRFTDKKAPHLTLLSFLEAWRMRPEARLTMAGGGELWESVRQLVVAYGLGQVVDLPGILTPDQVAERMRRSRAFVQHSVLTGAGDSEGTPLAVLEAMASGLPVVSTMHAGIPDVVTHGVSGLLSSEYDVGSMARHLVSMIDSPAEASGMGRAGRELVLAHHRVQDRVCALQQLLDRVAAGGIG